MGGMGGGGRDGRQREGWEAEGGRDGRRREGWEEGWEAEEGGREGWEVDGGGGRECFGLTGEVEDGFNSEVERYREVHRVLFARHSPTEAFHPTHFFILQDIHDKETERVNTIKRALREFAKYVLSEVPYSTLRT